MFAVAAAVTTLSGVVGGRGGLMSFHGSSGGDLYDDVGVDNAECRIIVQGLCIVECRTPYQHFRFNNRANSSLSV